MKSLNFIALLLVASGIAIINGGSALAQKATTTNASAPKEETTTKRYTFRISAVGEWMIVGMNGDVEALKKKFDGKLPVVNATAEQRLQIIQQFANKNLTQDSKVVAWGFNWQAEIDGKIVETGGPVWVQALVGDECADLNRYQPAGNAAYEAKKAFMAQKGAELKKAQEAKNKEEQEKAAKDKNKSGF